MGYVETNLMPGERICIQARLHWIIFSRAVFFSLAAAVLLVFALLASLSGNAEGALVPRNLGLALLVPGVWHALTALMRHQATELAVTSKRVVAKFGFIRRSTIELNHSKVESLHVDQGILGRIFGFGTLHINGTGGGITPIPNISDPLAFRRKAMEAIDASQSG
ncbi:MAG: PH domain-containing protein [Chlorobiaceae bacterium]